MYSEYSPAEGPPPQMQTLDANQKQTLSIVVDVNSHANEDEHDDDEEFETR